MSEYAPPAGPPPPKVPEGWKAVFNEQYKEWFYVNLHTKQSTWEKPTGPAPRPDEDAPPGAPPPSYSSGPNDPHVSDAKRPLESNNPYKHENETDEEMARRLQNEEDHPSNSRGASDDYYNSGNHGGPNPPGIQGGYPGAPSPSNPLPPRPESSGKSKGLFSKLLGKSSSSSPYPQHARPGAGYPPPPAGYQPGYPPQGYPPQGYGGYPPQGYGGYPPGGYGGGYGAPPRKSGGLGAGGAAALGLGGGLLGGALLADAINDGDQDAYQEGYEDGAGGGDFDGGDF
ncbi:uncharacterized protein Z518_00109 [Rhinocladiella mackenziei CBS 650.93]|uniref:WW domain-containing protein n=1 Tax=Rhinocladiella mackenziei CBS 650.93 TaxID=1442369 RepID=A0A0D2J094_9EURO|nr:uncharacterized protein Z518_00109 [Rhinocladiella mackenziei CBS 650.93]KIX09031.1 hypothetical protein Z518_00109 [Rhinocladiella mackenziei CBS 650.93]